MADSFRETFLGVGEVNPREGFCFMLGWVGPPRHRSLVGTSWMNSGQSFLLSGHPYPRGPSHLPTLSYTHTLF